jgi:excisionase family DNA binding protein
MPKATSTDGVQVVANAQKQLKLLTLQEAAEYARVSISTIRRWVRDEELPVYKAGRQKRVDETELVKFLSGVEFRFI